MTNEVEMIVDAIGKLQQEPNYFKDYMFPIASALFTSLLGAAIAYLTIKYQEVIKIEKAKMDSVNKWTLLTEEARATLIAIKRNYYSELTDIPAQRISVVPNILFHATPIIEKYEELAFIISTNADGSMPKWASIPKIRAMINNYNYLLKLWEQRNQLDKTLREKIMRGLGGDKSVVDVTQEEIIECIGESNFCLLVDITERAIILTDDLIVELNDFLLHFPSHAAMLVNTKKIKRYGAILKYSNNNNDSLLALIEKSQQVNYQSVEEVFNMSSEDIRKMHSTGYEKKSFNKALKMD